jgi:mannose-6-phosphate isomerase-like protein (cupin superfamily)
MKTQLAEPFILSSGESRGGKPLSLLGETIHIKISSADTGGRFTIIEETSMPGGGPPVHVHSREDEWFYVLEGSFFFDVDGNRTTVFQGGSVFAPRGVPHTFRSVSPAPGRLLVMMQPGGVERFFEKMDQACQNGTPSMETIEPIFEEFGMTVIGPPLAAGA